MREPVPAARHLGSVGRFKKMGPDGTSAGTQDSKAVRVIARTGSGVGSLVSLHNGTSRVDRAETWLES